MNNVTLVGRLTRDPERFGEGDKRVARFTLAVDRVGRDNGADFIQCVAFQKTADVLMQFITKGARIGVEGRITTSSYTNKDGNKAYSTDVAVNRIEFLDNKKTEEAARAEAPAVTGNEAFMQVPDGDDSLPFA